MMPVLSAFLGHVGPEATYWYLSNTPELAAARGAHPSERGGDEDLAPLLQRFFTDKFDRHLDASPHTKAAYADTFRLYHLR